MRKLTLIMGLCLGLIGVVHGEGIVVVGHPGASAMSKDQVADVFLGNNLAMLPVDLPESSSLRNDFYSKATGRSPSQAKAIWSRIVFSGKGQPPKEVNDDAAVKKAVAANPKAVGYISAGAVDGSVKVLFTVD